MVTVVIADHVLGPLVISEGLLKDSKMQISSCFLKVGDRSVHWGSHLFCRSRMRGVPLQGCQGQYASSRRNNDLDSLEEGHCMTENIDAPVRQFELMRNIHFQSFTSSDLIRPGRGLTSRPSARLMKPRAPRSLGRPYSLKYRPFHS